MDFNKLEQSQTMLKLNSLIISDSEFLHDLEVVFSKKCTIIEARNGEGKTTIFREMRDGANSTSKHSRLLSETSDNLSDIERRFVYIDEEFIYLDQVIGLLNAEKLSKDQKLIDIFNKICRDSCASLPEYGQLPKEITEIEELSRLNCGTGTLQLVSLCLIKSARDFLYLDAPIIFDSSFGTFDLHHLSMGANILKNTSNQIVIFTNPSLSEELSRCFSPDVAKYALVTKN